MKKAAYLFSAWRKIKESLREKAVYLFLDYDGTLVPIAPIPDKAMLPKKAKYLLRKLSSLPNCKIAVVSGRSLRDLRKHIGLKNIAYVGNHGFEIQAPALKFKSPALSRHRKALNAIKINIGSAPIKGLLLEDKGCSLSVHYRLAKKRDIPHIKEIFYSAALPHEMRNDIKVAKGKMVLEARPKIKWDKGKAVLWLLEQQKFANKGKGISILPIYIGDDISDEDAFVAVRDMGITVFVGGHGKSKALFRLKDTKDVLRFLKSILEAMTIK